MKSAIFLLIGFSTVLFAASPNIVVDGVGFGKSEVVSGTWFTNFENSRFTECDGRGCDLRSLKEWASIHCAQGACKTLNREALRLTRGRKGTIPEGSFNIRFIGRRGLAPHKSRYLGDGELDVMIEQVLDVRGPVKD